jgi:ethanolamine utilization protein EutQ (cupin superfamily)
MLRVVWIQYNRLTYTTRLFSNQYSTDTEKTIAAGFFRLLKGTPLVYSYTYDEMKIIIEGEFDISDECGNKVHAIPGDVLYFPKGSIITFETPTMGLGFFVGQRKEGEV